MLTSVLAALTLPGCFQSETTIRLNQGGRGKFVENPDNLKKLSKEDKDDPPAALAALQGIDGVKFETRCEVRLTFK